MDLNLDIFKITTNNVKPLKGRILIAEPFLQGYYFSRSIILLTEHNEEGSVGLVLNKPLDITLDKVLKDYKIPPKDLTCGGPVSSDKLFYIHTYQNIAGAEEIFPHLYFGGDFHQIYAAFKKDEQAKEKIRFFIGYSGWTNGQLTEEIEQNSWLVSDTNIKDIFKYFDDEFWIEVVRKMEKKYSVWANYPSNPDMN